MVTELTPGMLIGRYRLKEAIAEGGMGSVWSAVDTRLTRFVAVKLLPRILVTDPSAERRFEREARAMSRLQHPNVVSIYDIGSADPGTGEELPFLVMELIKGESLDQVVSRGTLDPRRCARILGQVGRALGAAHTAGVVHRDLKPSNIMIDDSDHVKVLDFGLARLVYQDGQTPEETLTTPGMVLGSCPYMSPEQALGQVVAPPSDIFSCGAVLYESLSGRRTFEGSTPMRVLQAVVRCDFTPLEEVAPDVPTSLQEVTERCLKKEPSERYANGEELARVLFDLVDSGELDQAMIRHAEQRTEIAEEDEPEPQPTPHKSRAITATLVAIALVIGGALGLSLGKRGAEEMRPDPSRWSVRTLFATGEDLSACDWHPDGDMLAASITAGEGSRIVLIETSNPQPRTLYSPTETEHLSSPDFSPDGQAVLVSSSINGRDRIRILLTRTGAIYSEIKNAGCGGWSAPGEIVYYRHDGEGSGLRHRDVETGLEKLLLPKVPNLQVTSVLPRSDGSIALLGTAGPNSRISVLAQLETGPTAWYDSVSRVTGLDWAPQGQALAFTLADGLYRLTPIDVFRVLPAAHLRDPSFSPDRSSLAVIEDLAIPGRLEGEIKQSASGDRKPDRASRILLFEGIDPTLW